MSLLIAMGERSKTRRVDVRGQRRIVATQLGGDPGSYGWYQLGDRSVLRSVLSLHRGRTLQLLSFCTKCLGCSERRV